MRAEYVRTVLTMWTIWFPLNFAMFALVPLRHQVVFMACGNLGWNVVLSIGSNLVRYEPGSKLQVARAASEVSPMRGVGVD